MNKLLIWGTGKLAEKFIDCKFNGKIIGFIETNKLVDFFMNKPVYNCDKFPREYDYIIVANSHTADIYQMCLKLNIDLKRVIFLYGIKNRIGCTDSSILKEILLEKNYISYCTEFGLVEGTFIENDKKIYQTMNTRKNFDIHDKYIWPIITDKYSYAGTIGNYFLQDLWAARLVLESGIKQHFDIGSRIDGFIAHLLSANINVTMIDVREFPEKIENLSTIVDDATMLHQIEDESIQSMSALCSLEHFGLGRYGDPIDPEACFKCFENIQKKLKIGGRLYLSVPVGKERVEFNAHRIFYASTIIENFSKLTLIEFSCASQGQIEFMVNIHKYDEDIHDGEYRYGLFCFQK